MRFLISILALTLASAGALEDDEFAEAAAEQPHFFTAETDLGMMSTFDGFVTGYSGNGTDGPYVPLNDSDIDGPYVPYEDLEDRGISTRVTCGSTRRIRSRTFPNRFPANEWEFWQFRVAPNVRFVLSCSSVHVPSPDNGLFFTVFQSSNLNLINSVLFRTGSNAEQRTFQRRDILSTEIKIFMTLIGSPSSSRTGTGLNCVVRGECTTNPPTTPSPPTPSPPTTTAPPGTLSCGQCAGSRALDSGDRIVNGNFANNDKYCFMGRLHSAFRSPNSFFCGGTLVSPNTVVTAAHCVDNIGTASSLAVSFNCDLGTCSRSHRASGITVHPRWNTNRLCSGGHDIAVIRLATSVPLSGQINFACLPNQGQCIGNNQIKQTAGYGRIFGGGPVSLRLKEANIRTETCGCSFSVTCARESTGRTCNGDSGSFMGSRVGGRWRLEGVTSFGFENCPNGDRMGFTEVCNFVTNFIVPNSGGGTQITG